VLFCDFLSGSSLQLYFLPFLTFQLTQFSFNTSITDKNADANLGDNFQSESDPQIFVAPLTQCSRSIWDNDILQQSCLGGFLHEMEKYPPCLSPLNTSEVSPRPSLCFLIQSMYLSVVEPVGSY
jgi:hypothetical protein